MLSALPVSPFKVAPTPATREIPQPLRFSIPKSNDPRIPFAFLLTLYAALGCTVLRFNRDPWQILLTVSAACLFDMVLSYVLKGRTLLFPLSAYITGLSLALLLNYSHNYYLLFLPVYLSIGSKYLLTYQGRHVFNPSMFGVAVCLLVGGDLISTAPAYQWGGTWAMSAFIVTGALILFVFKVRRNVLILSFLGFYLLQILLRAYLIRWFLPPEALIFGTLTSAPFYLFVFYMITDPKTSPSGTKGQIWLALSLTLVDLLFHLLTSLYTFFFAALAVGSARFVYLHLRQLWQEGVRVWLRRGVFSRQTRQAFALLGVAALLMAGIYKGIIHPNLKGENVNFSLVRMSPNLSGIDSQLGDVLQRVDPRVQHIAKWLLSVGDAAAACDYDNDGKVDVLLTQPLKRPEDRISLYRNLGSFHFERVEIPALREITRNPERYGLAAGAVFADYDNDGDQDLLLTMGYGKCVLLKNLLVETGSATFEDVTTQAGIDEYTISVAANFFDFDRDGKLDLLIANVLNPYLETYQPPRPLNIFHLPQPEYPGDRRMFSFMHSSWDNAENGGLNALYHNVGQGRFEKLDVRAWGMPETHWSLAIGTGDLNLDGYTDLYIANDFGPDDLYLNERGRHFRRIQGRMFGSVGRDTYKGMNSSLGDIDRNGTLDIYVSNVHAPLQAEGSQLWMTYPSRDDPFVPRFRDEATQRGALNEHRFGWGAAMGDLNLDGWLDIVQANGMVDDTPDKRFAKCRDYWYVNEKLMRSGPEIHTYADMWGDLRGYCINGREANRVYLNRGARVNLQFVDVASQVGFTEKTNSRGVVLADFDNDGDLDVGITHMFAPLSLYRNSLHDPASSVTGPNSKPHWIGFLLEGNGADCNKDAAGSRIKISYRYVDQWVEQVREISIVNGFSAQGDRRALFGLGDFAGNVEVSVAWCGEASQAYGPFSVGRYHTIKQRRLQMITDPSVHP
jgi:hypothetical protein